MEMPGFDGFFETGPPKKAAPPKPNDGAMAGMAEVAIPEEPPVIDDSGAFPKDSDQTKMREALKDGSVTEATITAAARRVLYEMDRFGYLDGKQKHTITPQDIEQNAAVIRQTRRMPRSY